MSDMLKTPHERLVRARIDAGFKEAKEAAAAHGWKYQTYKSHESGGRRYKVETAEDYARAFGVSAGWLLTGEQDFSIERSDIIRVPTRRVPLMDLAPTAALLDLANGKKPISDKYISVDSSPDIGPRAAAFVISGTAMVARTGPSFEAGDVVVIDPDAKLDVGCFVLAVVDNESVFRKFRPTRHGSIDHFELVPLNSDFPTITTSTDDGTRIVGRAIRHTRKL